LSEEGVAPVFDPVDVDLFPKFCGVIPEMGAGEVEVGVVEAFQTK
jgi:hypothetical protein